MSAGEWNERSGVGRPRNTGIALALVVAVIAAIVLVYEFARDRPSDEQIQNAMKSKVAYLFKADGKPRFHVAERQEPEPNWYIVTIRLDDVATEPGKMVLHQDNPSNDALTIVAGPGSDLRSSCRSFSPGVQKILCKCQEFGDFPGCV
jgi:hypothetical protein